MEASDTATTTTTTSHSSYPHPVRRDPAVLSPCAACKILRRRCVDKCVLAPYFPPTEPLKFTTAHRVFGASNIIKFLQELPESLRADAVSSMVYEAKARIKDPVYGGAGIICQLQRQVSGLQAQLAKTQAELLAVQTQHANLAALICMEMAHSQQMVLPPLDVGGFADSPTMFESDANCFTDDSSEGSIWETCLWT